MKCFFVGDWIIWVMIFDCCGYSFSVYSLFFLVICYFGVVFDGGVFDGGNFVSMKECCGMNLGEDVVVFDSLMLSLDLYGVLWDGGINDVDLMWFDGVFQSQFVDVDVSVVMVVWLGNW